MEWSPPPPETPKRIDKTPNKHLPWFCHHPTISFSLSSLPLGLFLSYKTAPSTVERIKEEESKAPENSTDSTTHQTLYTNSVKSGGIQDTKQKVWEQLLWFCGGLWSFFYIHRNAITLHFGNQLKSHFSLFFFSLFLSASFIIWLFLFFLLYQKSWFGWRFCCFGVVSWAEPCVWAIPMLWELTHFTHSMFKSLCLLWKLLRIKYPYGENQNHFSILIVSYNFRLVLRLEQRKFSFFLHLVQVWIGKRVLSDLISA